MDPEQELLSPDLVALLTAEKAREDIPNEVVERALRRVEVSIASAGAASATSAVAAATSKALALTGVVALVVGGALGAALHAAFSSSSGPPVVKVAPSATVAPAISPSPPVIVEQTIDVQRLPTAGSSEPDVATRAPTPSARATSSLARERVLLEAARSALTRDEAATALADLDRHATKFPGGELAEEREAMAVQALVASARVAEARERAAQFSKRYPRSILRPSVEAALRSAQESR